MQPVVCGTSEKGSSHVVSRASPYPPHYGYYTIAEGRVWSDSTGFRVRVECVECDVIDRNY